MKKKLPAAAKLISVLIIIFSLSWLTNLFKPPRVQRNSIVFPLSLSTDCDLPLYKGKRVVNSRVEDHFIKAACRALPRYNKLVMDKMDYKSMGVFFSEGLALVSAIEIAGATHVIESGTAEGQSTEILARYFEETVSITTVDRDSAYHLFEKTKLRLSTFRKVSCLKGDSFHEIPRLLSNLPEHARAVVFVDGPKGSMGMELVNDVLKHPQVVIVAFHDTAAVWDKTLHNVMMASPESILMTSEGEFRRLFGTLDVNHGEENIIRDAYKKHKWSDSKIPHLLSKGNGLWLTGKTNLEENIFLYDAQVHVALSADSKQLRALLVCLVSIVENTLSPKSLVIHIFVTSTSLYQEIESRIKCLISIGELSDVVKVHVYKVNTASHVLLKNRSDAAFSNLVRFYLPILLPYVNKILWVDIDGIVLGDVRDLLSRIFVDKYVNSSIAVVERPGKTITGATGLNINDFKNLELDNLHHTSSVFNAGFMGINLKVWRNFNVTEKIEEIIRKLGEYGFQGFPGISTVDIINGKKEPHDSQTPLVLLLRNEEGAVEHVAKEWNVEGLGWKQIHRNEVREAKYLHWSGQHKPWKSDKANHIEVWLSYAEALNNKCFSQAKSL